jgi:hypothetical protein
MKFGKTFSTFAVICAAAMLVGCGGSSSKDEPIVAPPPPPPAPAPTVVLGSVTSGGVALDQYASVRLVPATGASIVLTVNANGAFNQQVPAGTYTAKASRPGYTAVETPVTVTASTNNTVNIALDTLPKLAYIGVDDCAVCHADLYEGYVQNGHANKLRKIENGQAPTYPDGFDRTVAFSLLEGCQTGQPGARVDIECPKDWNDVAYALGGVYKLRYILKDGWVMSSKPGGKAQYDVPGTSYIMNRFPAVGNASEYLDGTRYDCGICHTTGFSYAAGNQDPPGMEQDPANPGIIGKWAFENIQCEACHGAGAGHAQSASKADITRKAGARRTVATLESPDEGLGQALSCYECHGRDSNRNKRGFSQFPSNFDNALKAAGITPRTDPQGGRIVAAASGLVRARSGDQTWTYWPASPAKGTNGLTPPEKGMGKALQLARSPSFLGAHGDCTTCHNPHASSRAARFLDNSWYTGPEGVDRSKEACMQCHSLFDPQLRTTGGMKDLQCVDCHAPYVSGTGVNWPGAGTRPRLGDIPAHIWTIDLGLERADNDPLPQRTLQVQDRASAGGGFVYPYLATDWACRTCHHNQAAVPGLNDAGVPGSYPALFETSDGLLKQIGFRFHNNLN